MKLLRRDKGAEVSRYINTMERHTVIVHTTSGTSIQGVLTRVYDDCLVLEAAVFLSASTPTKIDGEAVVERAKVAWLQRLGPSAPEEA